MPDYRASWYSQLPAFGWVDRGDRPGSNALGVPDSQQGIALPTRRTLGQWFNVTSPGGQTYRLQQTDVGPAAWTGRGVDISAAAANQMGYTPKTFPTDARFTVEPAEGGPMPDMGAQRKMPTNSLMDLMSGNAQYADTLGRPSNFNDALASRQMSLLGLGMGLLQPYMAHRGESPWTNALRGYMVGAQADQNTAQDAWKRGMAERQFAESNMTDFQKMQRDIGRYAGTPMEAEVKRFYAAKMGETPQLVSVEDPQNPGEKLSALFNPRAPSGQQFTDLQGRPLNIGGGGAAAGPSSAFDQPGAGRVGYGPAGTGTGGFGTGGFGTQPSGQAAAPAAPQYRAGPKTTEFETGLRKEISDLPEVKTYVQSIPSLRSMVESSRRNTRAADLDFVYGIAKIFDPTSVVREGEMKLASGTQSIPDDVQGLMRQVALGKSRLSEEARNRLLEVAHIRVGEYRQAYDNRITPYQGIMQRQRINPANVLPGMTDLPQMPFSDTEQKPPATSAAPPRTRWTIGPDGSPMPIP